MDNVILIGMPSCGKSTVGVILAKRMGYKFCDCDLLIQEREGKLLWELIEKFIKMSTQNTAVCGFFRIFLLLTNKALACIIRMYRYIHIIGGKV